MSRRSLCVLRHGPLTVYLKPLDGCANLSAFVETLPPDVPAIWLDSARQHPVTGRWSMVGCHPWLRFSARGDRLELRTSAATQRWRGHPLEGLRRILRRYRAPHASIPQARALGLMGFLSYDLNRWIERLPAPQPSGSSVPEMLWLGMRLVVLVDHAEQRSWLLSLVDPHSPGAVARREALGELERATDRLTERFSELAEADGAESASGWSSLQATSTQAEFERMVSKALESIRAGEIFQANVSQRFTASWRGRAWPLYRRLRKINPSPFACWFSCDDLTVVSCSPERLALVQDGRISTRPIAGTRPRGENPVDDAVNSLELLLSEKERAEHLMLVDLERNDLGRVCTAGSVSVDELMTLESYSHVLHIVSEVSGCLRRGTDAVDVIRAAFPGGTITGCPKVRCMEILRELEPVARGLYTGSLGRLGFDGSMDLNIAIRTIVIQGDRLSFHVGAGIVADSLPEREYQETLAKAAALKSALETAGALPQGTDARVG